MLLPMYGCSWAYWLGSTVNRWMASGYSRPMISDASSQTPIDQAQRPEHPGERAADEQRGRQPGQDGQHVVGEELGVLVGEADAGDETPRVL